MSQPSDMAAFVRIVELGGLAPAARGLGLTPSALSKQLARLEARLGVRLLTRTTRRIGLTPEGETYLARAHDIDVPLTEAVVRVCHEGVSAAQMLKEIMSREAKEE